MAVMGGFILPQTLVNMFAEMVKGRVDKASQADFDFLWIWQVE